MFRLLRTTCCNPLRTIRTRVLLTLVWGTLICGAANSQDLEPRAYSNSPIGLHFLLAGYGYGKGDILTDPSLPVDNAGVETHAGVLAYATTFNAFGQSGKFDIILPYASLAAEGLVYGVHRERYVTGFGDPLLRVSVNFFGAPALTAAEFADYKQDLIVGASLRVGVPLGQYDSDKLVNIGSNRWSLKPEIGISKALGPWTLELTPAMTIYTDNEDFFGGSTREQEPIYAVQGHVSYTFSPGFWIGIDGAWFAGGSSTLDGVEKNDRQEGTRLGLTLAVPITRQQSVKFYAMRGFNQNWGQDFDAVGVAWQYRWGGGF